MGARYVNEEQLLETGEQLIDLARKAGADAAEAAMAWSRSTETHIENSRIHTVQSSEDTVFGLRVLCGGSLGFITANDTTPEALAAAAADAVACARATPADEFHDLPEPEAVIEVPGLWDEAVLGLDAAYTTARASELVRRVREADDRVRIDSGSVSASVSVTALCSSKGVRLSERDTCLSGYLFGMAVDGDEVASFDYDGDALRGIDGFEAAMEKAAARFSSKCLSSLGAGQGASFRGTLVLTPEAVAEFLLPSLASAIAADAVRKGRSPLGEKLGQQIASPLFSVADDGSVPGAITSSAFDREGVAVVRRDLVREGRLETFLFNSYEARAAGGGAVSTGNAAGGVSALPGIGPHRLEVAAGDTAEADLIGSSERALVLGRYSGSTNGVNGDFSGVAKNAFLVEGGKRRPVKEVLIQGNIFELMKDISAVSRERRSISGSVLVPTIRAENVSITAG